MNANSAPCLNAIKECECQDDPIQNFSSESPDPQVFCAVVTFTASLPLGMCGEISSTEECCSTVSYLDAYLCALRKAQQTVWGSWVPVTCSPPGCPPNCIMGCPPVCDPPIDPPPPPPPPPPPFIYSNARQTCTVDCPDGSHFDFEVAAGTVDALSQLEADNKAHSLACNLARLNKICISTSSLPGTCINSSYSQTLHGSGGTPWVVTPDTVGIIPIIQCDGVNFGSTFPYVWTVIAGALPTGLTLHPCSGVIDGTPTAHGVYTFTVQATDEVGGHQQKEFSICVVEITDGETLPNATIGTAYSFPFNQEPGSAPSEKWTLISGVMPAGLTLDLDGTLHGTPTGPAMSVNLVIQVEVDCP